MLLKSSVLFLIILFIINIKSQNNNGRGDITLSPTLPSQSPSTKTPTIAITDDPCKFTDGCNQKNVTFSPLSPPTSYASNATNNNGRRNATLPPTSSPLTTSSTPYTSTVHSDNDNTNISSLLPTFSPSNDNITDGRNDNLTLTPTINTNSPTTSIPTMPSKPYDFIPTLEPTNDPTIEPTLNPTLYPSITPTIYPTINPTITPTMYNVGEVTEPKSTQTIYLTKKMGGERQKSDAATVSTIAIIIGVMIAICIIICGIICIKYKNNKKLQGKVKHEIVNGQKNKMTQYKSNKDSNQIQGETESDESVINMHMINKIDDDIDGDIITMVNATKGENEAVNDEFIIDTVDETKGYDDNDEDIIEVVNKTNGGYVDQFIVEDDENIIQDINETDNGYDIEMNKLNMITPQLDMNEEDIIEGDDLDIDNIHTIQ